MTDLDRETQAAIDALVHRLRNRTDEDDEPFALEFMMAMRLRGWRPTEARAPWDYRSQPAGDGSVSEEARRELDEARRASAEAAERLRAQAARERLRKVAARLADGAE